MKFTSSPSEYAVKPTGQTDLAVEATPAVAVPAEPRSRGDAGEETLAQRIAERFDGMGDQWHDVNDVHIEDVLEAADGERQAAGDIHLWILPDGSSVLALPSCWDLGPRFPDQRPEGYFAGLCNELSELEPLDLDELYEPYDAPNYGLVAFRVHSDPERWRRKYLEDSEEWSRQLGRWLDVTDGHPIDGEIREHVEMFADTLRPQHLARLLGCESQEVREWALTLARISGL
jgi:hypothetical protein